MAHADLLSQAVDEMHAAFLNNAADGVPWVLGHGIVNNDVAPGLGALGRPRSRAEKRQTEDADHSFCLAQSVGARAIVGHGNANGVEGIQEAAVWALQHILGADLHRQGGAE
eukprot:4290854-Pyramimonas_sp.AAC.1